MSAPAATERVRRLEEAGVIRGYRADVDAEKLGFPIAAIIRIEVPSGIGCATLLKSLEKIPEVLGAFRVTGTASAIVEAYAASPHAPRGPAQPARPAGEVLDSHRDVEVPASAGSQPPRRGHRSAALRN